MARFSLCFLLLSAFGSWTLAQPGSPGGNSACAHWCAANFANPGADCTSLAAHGQGPCYVCGPSKTSPTEQLCNGACSETSTDSKNCGKCGTVCPAGSTCSSGACKCTNSGLPPCNGACPDLTSDPHNCGQCGHACQAGAPCLGGTCGCPTGQQLCSGACVTTQTDPNNCGACGTVCPVGTSCSAGVCSCPSGQQLCGTTCVNLNTDPNNCGTCGLVCASGTCTNGACLNPSCSGETCATFGPCGAGGSCVCVTDASSSGFCVDGNTPCGGLASCGADSDCATGEVCAVGTCCGVNVCVGATFCGGSVTRRLFRRDWTNATIGHPAVWDP